MRITPNRHVHSLCVELIGVFELSGRSIRLKFAGMRILALAARQCVKRLLFGNLKECGLRCQWVASLAHRQSAHTRTRAHVNVRPRPLV